MINQLLLLSIIIPFAAGLVILITPKKIKGLKEILVLGATISNLKIAILLLGKNSTYTMPWANFPGFEFSLRIYNFSLFIILSAAIFGFLIALYSIAFLINKGYSKKFYALLLITFGFLNGAVLSDNLIMMLFFWEGLLLTLFGMIAIGDRNAFRTATKAFVIVGICDLCMMVGIALAGHLAGTMTISKMTLSITGLGGLAFILLVIGAISKSGSMPFHSWIPDAAIDAPLPVMATLPGALEKLIGIYFLYRICIDIFHFQKNSWASFTLMIVGALTIIFAVMMALVQKDYKRLLSYHAISQIGYMVLGIGTLVPAGIIGGLFHMINNAIYKSCLFLTGGSVEKQAGTTDLEKLGGIGSKMPITFACFIITAASISGIPPFNGFFSKELVYDGALERGRIFYIMAVAGSFFTMASFLKLGHAAFLGKISEKNKNVREAPVAMLLPMIILASICVLFGIYNSIPVNIFQSVLGAERLEGHTFAGMPHNMMLIIISVVVLLGAILNHIYGVKKEGSGLKAVDHIHYAPVLADLYNKAEKRYFDPYNIGMNIIGVFAKIAWFADKAIDWVYNVLSVKLAAAFTNVIRKMHNGNYSTYIVWSIAGFAIVLFFLLKGI